MSKWNVIPNEILNEILKYLKVSRGVYKCLTVNKQWHITVLSVLYNKVSIDIFYEPPATSRNFFNIIHSKYQPGKFVKTVTLTEYTRPIFSIVTDKVFCTDADPLWLLMTHCPHVKHFRVDYDNEESRPFSWMHFLNLLSKSGWKLQSLPKYRTDSNKVDFAYYLNCIYQSRNSLKELELSKTYGSNFNSFREFPNLTKILVDSIVDNIAGVDKLLSYFPNADEMRVMLSRDAEKTIENITYYDHNNKNDVFRNAASITNQHTLRKLHIANYTPTSDQDIKNDFQRFSRLKDLSIFIIERSDRLSWSMTQSITSAGMKDLFDFIRSIYKYNVQLQIYDDTRFLQMYPFITHHQQDTSIPLERCLTTTTSLSVCIVTEPSIMGRYFSFRTDLPFSITISNDNSIEKIDLRYDVLGNNRSNEIYDRAKKVIVHCSSHVQKCELSCTLALPVFGQDEFLGIEPCLALVHGISPSCAVCHLKIRFRGKHRTLSYQPNQGQNTCTRYTPFPVKTHLELEGAHISSGDWVLFSNLSTDLPVLESLHFNNCDFENTTTGCTVMMPFTSLDVLYLTSDTYKAGIQHFIFVALEDQEYEKCYIWFVENDSVITELSKSDFNAKQAQHYASESNLFTVTSVNLKSIKKLTLSSTKPNNCCCSINFS